MVELANSSFCTRRGTEPLALGSVIDEAVMLALLCIPSLAHVAPVGLIVPTDLSYFAGSPYGITGIYLSIESLSPSWSVEKSINVGGRTLLLEYLEIKKRVSALLLSQVVRCTAGGCKLVHGTPLASGKSSRTTNSYK